MKRQLGISAGVHIAALLALIIGLPSLVQEVQMSQQIIPVDIVNVADVTNTRVSEKPTPQPKPEPTKTEAPKPQPQPEPPKPEPKPEPPKEQPKPPEPPKPEEKAEVIPDKTKPKEPEKKPEPPKEAPKPEKKPEPKKEEPKSSLQNVLKNVAKLKDDVKTSPTPNPNARPDDKPVTSTEAPSVGSQLSISEVDALRRQISQCWNVPVGARGIDTMNVELYIEVNDDRTVSRVEVVDKMRMATDQFFRTVAESAVRALYNPKCKQLMLPQGKESEWSKIRMTFNPKDML